MSQRVTQAEFARLQGWARSYVTQLKNEGRLVMVEGLVDVDASRARIAETSDPNRDDVKDRNAQARGAESPEADADGAGDDGDDDAGESESKPVFAQWRARKERALAMQAELEYQKAAGKVVDIEAVQRTTAELGAQLRTALENLPKNIAAELAATNDAHTVRALLSEAIEQVLQDLGRQLNTISQTATGG